MFNESFQPVGAHTTITDVSAVQNFVPPASATKLAIQATDQNVRYRVDGVDPTATDGFVLAAGALPVVLVVRSAGTESSVSMRFIEETAGANLQYQWGK